MSKTIKELEKERDEILAKALELAAVMRKKGSLYDSEMEAVAAIEALHPGERFQMMLDAPTPETDEQVFDATPECEDLMPTMDVVTADFARRLERERDEARKGDWYQACIAIATRLAPITKAPGIVDAVDELLAERNQLRARVAELEGAKWESRTATANESLTVDLDAMLAACIPGGDTCDPQQVADSIREWFAEHHSGDANKMVPEPCNWSEDGDGYWGTQCGEYWTYEDGGPKEHRVKFCPGCGKPVEAHAFNPEDDEQEPDADGMIPHTPGDPMPCDPDLLVEPQLRDGHVCRSEPAHLYCWDASASSPNEEIIAWRPAKP